MKRYVYTHLRYALRCYERQRLAYEMRLDWRHAPDPEGFLVQLPQAAEYVRERGDRLAGELPTCLALLDLLEPWQDDPRYAEYRQAVEGWMADHPHVQLPRMRRLKPLAPVCSLSAARQAPGRR